jgi:hypothetical protein
MEDLKKKSSKLTKIKQNEQEKFQSDKKQNYTHDRTRCGPKIIYFIELEFFIEIWCLK